MQGSEKGPQHPRFPQDPPTRFPKDKLPRSRNQDWRLRFDGWSLLPSTNQCDALIVLLSLDLFVIQNSPNLHDLSHLRPPNRFVASRWDESTTSHQDESVDCGSSTEDVSVWFKSSFKSSRIRLGKEQKSVFSFLPPLSSQWPRKLQPFLLLADSLGGTNPTCPHRSARECRYNKITGLTRLRNWSLVHSVIQNMFIVTDSEHSSIKNQLSWAVFSKWAGTFPLCDTTLMQDDNRGDSRDFFPVSYIAVERFRQIILTQRYLSTLHTYL